MTGVLTYKGVSTKWAEFCKLPNYNEILKSMEIVNVSHIGKGRTKEKRTQVYYRYGDRIMIARFEGFQIFSKIINCIRKCETIDIDKCLLKLHKHQQTVFDYIMSEIYNDERVDAGNAGCVVKLRTGMGKTFLAMGLIAEFSVKTLIIVPNEAILEQWAEIIMDMFPNIRVGYYYGKKKRDGDIVMMVAKSASSPKYNMGKILDEKTQKKITSWYTPIDYFSRFGFVVFDEIHKYPTEKLGKMFWRTCASRVLGLTASPYSRSDKFDRVYFSHVGELIDGEKVPGFTFDEIPFDVEVRRIEYHGPPEFTKPKKNRNGDNSFPLMVQQCAADPHRNVMIVNLMENLLAAGRFIYAMAEHRNHLSLICGLLRNRGIVADTPEISNIMGGSTAEELNNAKKHAKVLLTTYGYGTAGISINRMDTLVLISPRVSYMDQVTGRIKRLGGDSSIKRIVVDIVDYNTSLRSQSYKRNSSFREEGYEIMDKYVIDYFDDRCDENKRFSGDFWKIE